MADSVIEFVWPDSYNEAVLQKASVGAIVGAIIGK
jgi:hypothetical protein